MVKASGTVRHLAERTANGSALSGDVRHSAHALGHPRRAHRYQRAPASQRTRPVRRGAQRHNRELRRACAASWRARATSSAARPTPRSWPTCSRSTTTATSSAPSCARPAGWRAASSSACSARRSRAGSSASRRPAPLIVGLGVGENFFASDVTALVSHTKNVIYLDDGEFAELTPESVTVYDRTGREITKTVSHVVWDIEAAEKGGYEHFMMKEIMEQPRAVKSTIAPQLRSGRVELDMRLDLTADRPRLQADSHHRLRQRLPRRRGGQVRHRVALPRPRGGGARQRAALPRPDNRPGHAADSGVSVRRDGGHHSRDARVHGPRGQCARHSQRGRQHDSPPGRRASFTPTPGRR